MQDETTATFKVESMGAAYLKGPPPPPLSTQPERRRTWISGTTGKLQWETNRNVEAATEAVGGCAGKARFDTPTLAGWVAAKHRRLGAAGKARATPRDVYRCKACGGWHLGRNNHNMDRP